MVKYLLKLTNASVALPGDRPTELRFSAARTKCLALREYQHCSHWSFPKHSPLTRKSLSIASQLIIPLSLLSIVAFSMSETKPESDPSTTAGSGTGSTYTEMASNAASGVAGSATNAATGVKDSVFSMFGGGQKKEKAPEEEGEQDRSGSSKAKKDAEEKEKEEGGAEDGVGCCVFIQNQAMSTVKNGSLIRICIIL